MNLIGQDDVNATSYKRASVIMFDNTGDLPEMRVFEDVMSQHQPPVSGPLEVLPNVAT